MSPETVLPDPRTDGLFPLLPPPVRRTTGRVRREPEGWRTREGVTEEWRSRPDSTGSHDPLFGVRGRRKIFKRESVKRNEKRSEGQRLKGGGGGVGVESRCPFPLSEKHPTPLTTSPTGWECRTFHFLLSLPRCLPFSSGKGGCQFFLSLPDPFSVEISSGRHRIVRSSCVFLGRDPILRPPSFSCPDRKVTEVTRDTGQGSPGNHG